MGYDFVYFQLRHLPVEFPAECPETLEREVEQFMDLGAIRDQLISRKGFRQNGDRIEGRYSYFLDTPDGGLLDLMLDKQWISVDTHAHWRFVLEVYECLLELFPRLVIFDPQTMQCHDRASYEHFVDESYRRKDQASEA